MTDIPSPFCLHQETVGREWLDINGHMNVAFFGLVFDRAGHALLEALRIGRAYIADRRRGMFVIENHGVFEREAHLDDSLAVSSRLLGVDRKRLHLFHELIRPNTTQRLATLEVMALQVDLDSRRPIEFEDEVFGHLAQVAVAHARLSRPQVAGRGIVQLQNLKEQAQ